MMRYFGTLCLVMTAATVGYASPSVYHLPDHPMADVMGYVLATDDPEVLSCTSDDPCPVLNPPYQSGWPLNINDYAGDEGGLLVNADADPELEVLFRTGLTVHLMDDNGSYLPGWPITVSGGTHSTGQPAFGDLDGDGMGEVVMVSDNWPNGSTGWTWAYETDGTLMAGFPFMTAGDHTKSPTVADLFGDGTCEIIVSDRDYPTGNVYVCNHYGQILSDWPIELDHVPAASAGAADIDNDGDLEIVFQSYSSIFAWDPYGTLMPGFPYTPSTGDVFSYSAPTFADIDGDGCLEIASGGHKLSGSSHLILINHDGTDVAGWPKAVPYWIYGPATFADMDGDDDLELMVGDQVLSGTLVDMLYAWHHDGSYVTGWPVGPIEAVNSQVAAADIDGDGDPEFIWDTNITPGKLMGYHHDGTAISGWPITTDGSSFFNTAALGDVDGDGDMELLLPTTFDTPLCTVHLWDMPEQADPVNVQMPMFQYGPGRDGLICNPPPQGVEGSGGSPNIAMSAFPNPFTSSLTITVSGLSGAPGEMTVFDLSGRTVAELQPAMAAGQAVYTWNAMGELPSGVYCARLSGVNDDSSMRLLKL